MKLLVIGPLCSGKTTICRHLRAASVPVVDLDDELVRVNGGVYPDIDTRKTVVAPQALANVAAMPDVVVFHSTLDSADVYALKAAGFTTALLEVSEAELRHRHKVRLDEEGWSNERWFEDNQALIDALRRQRLFDHVIDAEPDVAVVAAHIVQLATGGGRQPL